MIESLRFIVVSVNKLLDTNYNMLSFDTQNPNCLLQIVINVLNKLEIGGPFRVQDNVEESVIRIMRSLGKVKYEPINMNPLEFREGVTKADTSVIYPILTWLLANQNKVQERAYLSEYVNKMLLPPEVLSDPDINVLIRVHQNTLDSFWSLYNENKTRRRSTEDALEIQQDIKKMVQDIQNIVQRVDAQKSKMDIVSNRERLITLSKEYRNTRIEERHVNKQNEDNFDVVKKLEYELRIIQDILAAKKGKRPIDTNILKQVNDEYRANKIFYESQLPEELGKIAREKITYDKVASGTTLALEDLKASSITLKNDVQKLTNEKLTRFSSSEDELGPFRNQTAIVANRKQEISNTLRDLKERALKLDDTVIEKEKALHILVGGEVLHGDQLKSFIANLREKSAEYKRKRCQLQSLTSEFGVASRTLDALKSIDPTSEQILLNEPKWKINDVDVDFTDSVSEAKQLCRQFLIELEALKGETSQIYHHLKEEKGATHDTFGKSEEVKMMFEKATEFLRSDIGRLKDSVEKKITKIEQHEDMWKKTKLELEKYECMFTRLLDDFVTKTETPAQKSYLEGLNETLKTVSAAMEKCQKELINVEEFKKEQRKRIDFLKIMEDLVKVKLQEK